MSDVSRETPPVPPQARGVFGASTGLAIRYAGLLATDGVVRGLLGPREAPRLWERHLLNSAALSEVVPAGARVADVGSGAGLPGLPLAIARPDLTVVLVEPLLRRTRFLDEVVDAVGLGNRVTVVRARAEALHGLDQFDVVTSRAVAALPRLLEWCMPLVSGSGSMLAMKGASIGEEIEAAGDLVQRWGLSPPEVLAVGDGLGEASTTVVRVSWADPGRVGWGGSRGDDGDGAARARPGGGTDSSGTTKASGARGRDRRRRSGPG
jgi:16S rRNA (guanine527-N7)-methyltransferase